MDYPKPNLNATSESAAGKSAIIESYLDALCAPLHQMPQDAQDEIRQEIGAHLQSLVAMQREPERVLESALQQFGEPSEIGRLLALEWENREWDLSGLPWAQRIEKLRSLFAEQERTSNKKRNNRSNRNRIVFMLMATLLLTRIVVKISGNRDWLGAINFAMYVACVLSFVFFTVTALQAWQQKRAERKSAMSCHRAFVTQFNFALIGSIVLLPSGGTAIFIVVSAFCAIGVLVIASSLLEPSRKSRLFAKTSLAMSGVMGISLIAISTALQPLGDEYFWIQIVAFVIVSCVIRYLFFGVKSPSSQKAE